MKNTNCMPDTTCPFEVEYAFNKQGVKLIKTGCSPSQRDFKENAHLTSSVYAKKVMEQKHGLHLPVLNRCN